MAAARRVRRISLYVLAAMAVLSPGVASAAGLDAPENGAYVLARGGTSAALDGTAYSLMFNPAGLTGIDSWDIRIDARLVGNGVTFLRAPRQYDGSTSAFGITYAQASNSAGPSMAPSALVAYHPQGHILRQFSFGVGIYAPPGVSSYQFPSPADSPDTVRTHPCSVNEEGCFSDGSGQRYALIQNNNLILFPSLAIAWSPIKYFSLGLTVQAAYASISLSQAIASSSASGYESTESDAIANLNVTDPFKPTFIAGVMLHPVEGLTLGTSFRPQVALDATGTLTVTPPPGFSMAVTQQGDAASLKLNLQPEARAGIAYERGRWSVAGDFVYEGWAVNQKFVLDASQVTITNCTEMVMHACAKSSLGTTTLTKDWQNTYSGRIGGSFRIFQQSPNQDFGLQVHLGGLFETNAIPGTTQDITAVTGTRIGFSTGITAAYGDVALTVAGMYYLPVTLDITNNQTARQVATGGPDNPPVLIDNGIYTATLWVVSAGIAWTPHTSF